MKLGVLDRRLRRVEAAQLPAGEEDPFPLAWLHELELWELHEIGERARGEDPDLQNYETIAGSDGERARTICAAARARFERGEPRVDPTGGLSAEAHTRECRIYHQELYPAARDSGQSIDEKALRREARRRAWAEVEAARDA